MRDCPTLGQAIESLSNYWTCSSYSGGGLFAAEDLGWELAIKRRSNLGLICCPRTSLQMPPNNKNE